MTEASQTESIQIATRAEQERSCRRQAVIRFAAMTFGFALVAVMVYGFGWQMDVVFFAAWWAASGVLALLVVRDGAAGRRIGSLGVILLDVPATRWWTWCFAMGGRSTSSSAMG